jgi:hypothetical protein
MADVHWSDRYAVDGMFIHEMLLRERNEVTERVHAGSPNRAQASERIPELTSRRYARPRVRSGIALILDQAPSGVEVAARPVALRGWPRGNWQMRRLGQRARLRNNVLA